jgi:hypothetical protein
LRQLPSDRYCGSRKRGRRSFSNPTGKISTR